MTSAPAAERACANCFWRDDADGGCLFGGVCAGPGAVLSGWADRVAPEFPPDDEPGGDWEGEEE